MFKEETEVEQEEDVALMVEICGIHGGGFSGTYGGEIMASMVAGVWYSGRFRFQTLH